MTALYGMGWTNVRALKATFEDWSAAGNPVAAGVPEVMALNVAEPDAALVAAADAYLVGIKDHGVKFGVTTAELLNTALAENVTWYSSMFAHRQKWMRKVSIRCSECGPNPAGRNGHPQS